ncbi:MAG: 16S rRNA (adenine(1518)-N(6)/adenine(1519)-N(6))-dimethyltransferase RsmA [bacterium]
MNPKPDDPQAGAPNSKLARKSREILSKYGLRLRKSLGQNLLVDEGIFEEIIAALDLRQDDWVLEIGSGIGFLTSKLAEKAGRVVAIEIDPKLIFLLRQELKDFTNLDLIEADILKVDLDQLMRHAEGGRQKAAANLPYYITSPVIMHLLKFKHNFTRLVIMVQKEVGKRILSRPGTKDYGVLSIAVQYHTEPRLVTYVDRKSFFPSPAVDSMVLTLDILEQPRVGLKDEGFFFKVVKAAFSQRRKMLRGSLRSLGLEGQVIIDLLTELGIDPARRGETLSLEEFAAISDRIRQ